MNLNPFKLHTLFLNWLNQQHHLKEENVILRGELSLLREVVSKALDVVNKEGAKLPLTPTLLAERCFDAFSAEDDLFDKVNVIMGYKSDGDFSYPVMHTCVDSYDSSVEVLLDYTITPPMTRAQADAILALGFKCVYETYGDKEARCWTRTDVSPCSPREWSEDNYANQASLKAKLVDANKMLEKCQSCHSARSDKLRALLDEAGIPEVVEEEKTGELKEGVVPRLKVLVKSYLDVKRHLELSRKR